MGERHVQRYTTANPETAWETAVSAEDVGGIMQMTGRERFLRLVAFQPVDRGFNYELGVWSETVERWRGEGLPQDLPRWGVHGYFGFDRLDIMEASLPLHPLEMVPPFEVQVLEEDERYVVQRHSDGHVSRALKAGTSMDQYLSFPVQSRGDFEEIKKRYDPYSPERYPAHWDELKRSLVDRDFPLQLTRRGRFGLFSAMRSWMGTERALTLFYDDPHLAHEMLDFLAEYFLQVMHRAVTETQPDWFQFAEDFAYKAGPMFGPEIFRQFLLPRYRRITDFLRSHGVRHIWLDSDGDTQLLIPLMIDAGITGHHPLERAAGMDPLKLRAEYGHDLALMGGIDKRALAKGREAIEEEVYHHVPQLLEDGGYIPTVDHTVPFDVPYDNFCYYMDLKRKLLGY